MCVQYIYRDGIARTHKNYIYNNSNNIQYIFNMAHLNLSLLLVVASALCVNSQSVPTTTTERPTTPYEPSVLGSKYGYYEVRDGAHMFYWYFEKAHKPSPQPDAPLIVWLTTASSTGYGNFEEIGTHYKDGGSRDDAWTKYFNVLFVDSPVGLGFSYTEKDSLLTTNNSQAADDLLEFIRKFCADNTRLTAGAPIYVVGESFAAKATLEFVIKLNEKIQAGEPEFELIKLAGVVLASPFISPAHSLSSMTEYLKSLAIIDIETSNRFNAVVTDITAQSGNGTSRDAVERLSEMLKDIATVTRNVNLFDVLNYDIRCETCNSISQYEIPFFLHPVITKELFQYMNTKVKQGFRGVVPSSVVWNSQVNKAFKKLQKDVLSSSMNYSQAAELADAGVKVVVVNGQLDGITPAIGTMNWMQGGEKNKTDGKGFSNRRPFICNHDHLGYVAEFGNMNVYTILSAGHYITVKHSTALLKLVLKETGLKYNGDSHDHHPTTPSYHSDQRNRNRN